MIEEGPDSFMQHWRAYAAQATLFPRPEGTPMLEAEVAGCILQLFERTNPYHAPPGPARLVLHVTAERWDPAEVGEASLRVPVLGTLHGRGRVKHREGRTVVVDAGAPLVLTFAGTDAPAPEGRWIHFEAPAPLHAFVLPPVRKSAATPVDDAL
ncbi:MAG: hypothetical protein U5K81_07685 [Trueperaceae bacterium]|nr:hypothetical protein [Trueperaceae bacterium]